MYYAVQFGSDKSKLSNRIYLGADIESAMKHLKSLHLKHPYVFLEIWNGTYMVLLELHDIFS